MKIFKWAIIVSFIICIPSFIISLVLNTPENSYYSNVCVSIFGSSLLVLATSTSGYFIEKKRDLEAFFHEAQEIINKITGIKYLNTEMPSNYPDIRMGKIEPSQDDVKIAYLIMDSHITASKCDLSMLNQLYSNLEFLLKNGEAKKELLLSLYIHIQAIIDKIEKITQYYYDYKLKPYISDIEIIGGIDYSQHVIFREAVNENMREYYNRYEEELIPAFYKLTAKYLKVQNPVIDIPPVYIRQLPHDE